MKKVVIIHGLFMKSPLMWPLQWRLQQEGFICHSISYQTYWHTLAENVRQLQPEIAYFANGEPLHFIGHSLGGLFIRHLQAYWPEGFNNSRVVTIGTPHQGCAVANFLKEQRQQRAILRNAYPDGLDGHAPPWPRDIPLLSIAGSKPLGVGQIFRGALAKAVIHDGVVEYRETLLPEAQAFLLCHETHTGMIYSRKLIKPIRSWLETTTKSLTDPK